MNPYMIIGFLITLLLYFVTVKADKTRVDKTMIKAETIMCSVIIMIINYAFLLLICFTSILQNDAFYTEIVGALLIIISWSISSRYITLIDPKKRVACCDKYYSFFFTIITAIIVSFIFSRSEGYRDLVRISSISVAVFLGTFVSIDSFYGEFSNKPVEDIIKSFSDRLKSSALCKLTCLITALFIILISVTGEKIATVSIAFMGIGVGMSIGALLVVLGYYFVIAKKNDKIPK